MFLAFGTLGLMPFLFKILGDSFVHFSNNHSTESTTKSSRGNAEQGYVKLVLANYNSLQFGSYKCNK
jgi:hypothetical protein